MQKTLDTKVLLTMFDGQVVHDRGYGVGDPSLVDPEILDGLDGGPDHGPTTMPIVTK